MAGLWPILLNQSVKEGLTVTRSQAPYRAKMATHMKATVGETFITVLISGALAFVAALAGFFGAAALCFTVLRGEMTQWGLILSPATALVCAVTVFLIALRKIGDYGERPD